MIYIIGVLIGISLGLIGAGGAIVAVPAFVYLEGIPPTLASGYALFVVAIASAVASAQYMRQRLVDWRSVMAFGSTTIVSIAITRRVVMPVLPDVIAGIPRDSALMLAFAAVLLTAAYGMLRMPPKPHTGEPAHMGRLAAYGTIIGVISGILGVGGGFLMTPALVLWAGLDMKRAVATSLVLISANSAIGVAADLSGGVAYDWSFVRAFTVLTTVGIITGTALSRRIDGQRLKKSFGWFILAIGIAVAVRELSGLT
ncbi:MAG: sulfite exporter TauE/SafE family protein [Candidatus Kapabacteria bacterium]|nr:sulfite exporter TauE/SafE family protein [Candidatus Kapabacteria bacterium]